MRGNAEANDLTMPQARLRRRFLGAGLFFVGLPALLIYVVPVAPRNGLSWDFAMGAGFVAMGLMLALPVLSTRVWFSYRGDARGVVDVLRAHRFISYIALALVALHIVLLIIVDTTVIEYLKPSAPWPQLAALAATLIFLFVVVQSELRMKLKMRYRRWRHLHGALAGLCVLGAAYHVVAAHYYVNSAIKLLVFALVCVVLSVGIFFMPRSYRPRQESRGRSIAKDRSLFVRAFVYAVVLTWFAVFTYAIPPVGNRTEQQVMQCVIGDC